MADIRILKYNASTGETSRHLPAEDSLQIKSISFQEAVNAPFTVTSSEKVVNLNSDKIDGKDVNDTDDTTASLWTAGKIKSFITDTLNQLDPQESVLSMETDPTLVTPSNGDRYVVGTGGTGDWTGYDDSIVEYDGSGWVQITPDPGFFTYVEDESVSYLFNGTDWVKHSSTASHNIMNGLQGGTSNEYYHLTNTQHSLLTGGGSTALHKHNTDNLDEGTSNLFYTDERAQDSVGLILVDSDSIDLTYNDSTPSISASVRIDNTGNAISASTGSNGIKFSVVVDDVTIQVNGSNELEVIDGSIDVNKLATGIDATGISFNADKVDGKDVGEGSDDLWLGSKIADHVSTVVAGSGYQRKPVSDVVDTPPSSPSNGDRYIIDESPTGAWIGHAGEIAEWSTGIGDWDYRTPEAGWQVKIVDGSGYNPDEIYYFDGSSWTASIKPIAETEAYSAAKHVKKEVIGMETDPTLVTPSNGDRYIVGASATGDWTGHDGEIAEWDSGEAHWEFETVNKGDIFKYSMPGDDSEKYEVVYFDGSNFISIFEEFIKNTPDVGRAAIDIISTPPVTPSNGDTYIVGDSATGDWSGLDDYIVSYSSSEGAWISTSDEYPWLGLPNGTRMVPVLNEGRVWVYTGTTWEPMGEHNNITDVNAATLTDGVDSDASHLHTHLAKAEAGESLAQGDVIYIDPTDGRAYKALGTTVSGKYKVLGVAAETASIGQETGYYVEQMHVLDCSSMPSGGWSSLTSGDNGKYAFLSNSTAGEITTTPPSSDGDVVVKVAIIGTVDSNIKANLISSMPIIL